jgi:benzodiazapine receptor
MTRYLPLLLFIALVLGGGSLLGASNVPGAWYEGLEKPFFNPPNWLFGPVWSVLYVLIAIAGWRIWRLPRTGGAMTAWWVQLGLNFLWSPVFFTLQNIGLALVVIVAMLIAILAFIVLARPHDRIAALLFVPYAAWVAFATLLNGAIFVLN